MAKILSASDKSLSSCSSFSEVGVPPPIYTVDGYDPYIFDFCRISRNSASR